MEQDLLPQIFVCKRQLYFPSQASFSFKNKETEKIELYYGPILYFKDTKIVIGMSVATSTLWKVSCVEQRNYAAQFHATTSCIKFGEGAQSPRN